MAYKQPYSSPNLRLDKDKTMKVRINRKKYAKRGGELSSYAEDHITKTNKKGKVTIEVPKSEMNSNKSKLFSTSIQKWTSNPYGESPSQQPTAKGFKKQRNKDRIAKTSMGVIAAVFGGGGAAISSLQNKNVNI